MTPLQQKLEGHPKLQSVVDEVLRIWPDHRRYCEIRFRDDSPTFLAHTEEFADLAVRNMGGDLPQYAADYRWMCERFLEEEIYFHRKGHYRLSTFAETYDQIYNDLDYMTKYVRGILISQIIWDPHARAFDTFRTEFLTGIPANSSYLEIGPGHGLFLYFAAQCPQIARLEAWDVSQASIQETKSALKRLNIARDIKIIEQDILLAPGRHKEFDAAVISEVLEHLERPDLALQSLNAALKPGGRIFINAPINSPAPDHIFLWRTTDELVNFVVAQGFKIEAAHFYPVTGYSLERAKKTKCSVSCILIASK